MVLSRMKKLTINITDNMNGITTTEGVPTGIDILEKIGFSSVRYFKNGVNTTCIMYSLTLGVKNGILVILAI